MTEIDFVMKGIDFIIGYLASGGVEITVHLLDFLKKENTFVNHDLQKAVRRSYLSSLKDIASGCRQELLKDATPLLITTIYPSEHSVDLKWLDQKIKSLKKGLKSIDKEQPVDVSFQSLDEIQTMLKPSGSSAKEIIHSVKERLTAEALKDDTAPVCYKEAVEKELFEQMCAYFAREIKDKPNVRHIFDSQVLVQINSTLSDQHKKILNIEEFLMKSSENKESESLKIVLIYKRNAEQDEQILNLLEKELVKAGHSIFIDRHIKIGDEWEKQISDEIRNADAVVILLSPLSIYSEMLAYEVDVAYKTAQENKGKPRLFPV